jgi:hypothetical protein
MKRGIFEVHQPPPPTWCVDAVGEAANSKHFRRLTAVSNSPILRPDGTVASQDGYDVRSEHLIYLDDDYPAIPDKPTLDDVRAAVVELKVIVADFPFVADHHWSAWLASVLTPIARSAYTGCTGPLFLLDANVRGSGKTMLAQVGILIATGRDPSVYSQPRCDDEARKRITSMLLCGERTVLIDNISHSLGSASLDAALTSAIWKDRILGESRIVELPLRLAWFASGNNVILKADTARRVCPIRLESDMENPNDRQGFRIPNLRRHVQQNRPALYIAALTILRGFIANGRPEQNLRPWGSYEEQTALVRQAIVWAGEPDPGEARSALREQSDADATAIEMLLDALVDLKAINVYTGKSSKELIDMTNGTDELSQAAGAALVALCGDEKPKTRTLGDRLRHFKRRVIGDRQLDSEKSKRGFV